MVYIYKCKFLFCWEYDEFEWLARWYFYMVFAVIRLDVACKRYLESFVLDEGLDLAVQFIVWKTQKVYSSFVGYHKDLPRR